MNVLLMVWFLLSWVFTSFLTIRCARESHRRVWLWTLLSAIFPIVSFIFMTMLDFFFPSENPKKQEDEDDVLGF